MVKMFMLTMCLVVSVQFSWAENVIEDELYPVTSYGLWGNEYGTYTGKGYIQRESGFPARVGFFSTRKLIDGGVLEIETVASILWFEVRRLKASLKIVAENADEPFKFVILDLNNKEQKSGEGICMEDACSFSVSLMGGDLFVEETWTAFPNKILVEGSQILDGDMATYTFELKK